MWDADAAMASEFADRHGVVAMTDRAALISASDAVAICSATSDHVGLVRAAAEQGRPVLCEKPLGTTMAECDTIAAIVADSGIRFMQGFPKRFDPVNHEVAALLAEGAIGRVTLCRIRHGHSHGFDPSFRQGWFADPAFSGGGTLLDEGVHAADFLCWLFGDPHRSARLFHPTTSVCLSTILAAAIFRYANGIIAEVTTSWALPRPILRSRSMVRKEPFCSAVSTSPRVRRATVTSYASSGATRMVAACGRRSTTVPYFKTGVFHEHVAWAFLKALKDGGPMPITLQDGRRAFAMIDAAYRSAQSGRTETVDMHLDACR